MKSPASLRSDRVATFPGMGGRFHRNTHWVPLCRFQSASVARLARNKQSMTKADLVADVAKTNGLTRTDAEVVVQTVLDSIVEALNSGEKVELRGFGSFRHRQRSPRRGRNPKTGEIVQVPAKRVAYFRLGKGLKELLNS